MTGRQLTIFGTVEPETIVNVASVPQRSPFRYPGGKTWLVPHIRMWLSEKKKRPSVFIEPFAGGAITGLTVAFEKLADHVVLVELDQQVAAVWETILGGDAEWLAGRILSFDLTLENVKTTLAATPKSNQERAFQTILKNRTYHGGILAPGSGLIKNGENGKGIKSRWYPETLAKRIRAIGMLRDCFTFIHGDGIETVGAFSREKNAAFFIDPPYTVNGNTGKRAGKRLYMHSELDHTALFKAAIHIKGDVLMTYDNCEDVQDLAKQHAMQFIPIAMKNTHHAKMTELLVGKNLDWLR